MADASKDNLFVALADQCHGIEPLLDSFFEFLQRRTDFYHYDHQTARAKVIEAFDKYAAVARKVKEESAGSGAAKNNSEEAKFLAEQERLKNAPPIEEVFDDHDLHDLTKKRLTTRSTAPGASASTASKAKEVKRDVTDSGSSDTTKNTAGTEEAIGGSSDDSDGEGDRPIGNGGICEKYRWTQTLQTVEVYVPVEAGTSARQCKISINSNNLKVIVKGETLLDGQLHSKIRASDSFWLLEDQKTVHLTLEKQDGMHWWNCVLKGDRLINTKKIVPENSKLEDLAPDLRSTVEKMMHDQEMKARGLPTSDQTKQSEIFEAFKKAHPEMDFSKAKINY